MEGEVWEAEPFPARHLISAGVKDFYTQDHLGYIQHLSYSTSKGQESWHDLGWNSLLRPSSTINPALLNPPPTHVPKCHMHTPGSVLSTLVSSQMLQSIEQKTLRNTMGSIHPSPISPGMLYFAQRSCGFPFLEVLDGSNQVCGSCPCHGWCFVPLCDSFCDSIQKHHTLSCSSLQSCGEVLGRTESCVGGTEGGKAGEGCGELWGCTALPCSRCGPPASPALLPSGTCYSWNTKSCGSQIRLVQGPGEERQPRARLLVKKLLLNFSCCLGGPAAGGQCRGMRGDHRTHRVGKDLRGHRIQPMAGTEWHIQSQKGHSSRVGHPAPLLWGGMLLGGWRSSTDPLCHCRLSG